MYSFSLAAVAGIVVGINVAASALKTVPITAIFDSGFLLKMEE